MESEKISQNPTVNKKTKSAFSILLTILLFFLTPLLIYQTLQVQNSPEPLMIQWSQEESKEPKTDDFSISNLKSKGMKILNQAGQYLPHWHFPSFK